MTTDNNADNTIDKNFDPAAIETKWYAHWEATNAFRPERPNAQPYTIVNPPPNVTGSLHIGHALDNTLQDILIRHARLQGKDALWVVGTDHAGIATQMVVERQMNAAGQKRTDLTREEFVAKVWEWKAESGGEITGQLRRLGCSMDWQNERFTMDEGFSKAVIKVFVDLYNEGLLYRDKRLVNWDPGLKTAISDLEVETREINGKFWHFRYPLAADENGNAVTTADGKDYIVVATTRPETMLADMAVAVNARDERYASVVGKHIILPITGRRIPIITDDHADPELGSGAVKITPGHDFNDFEVGKRNRNLIKPYFLQAGTFLNIFDEEARIIQLPFSALITDKNSVPVGYEIPAGLIGLDRFAARTAIVEQMKIDGFLVPQIDKNGVEQDFEPRKIQTPYGDRSGVVIEPWLTDQWYVDAQTLAGPAIEAVRSGAINIVPKSWEKTYFNWMENIQPWCVSRQLWWGHRIPAWYFPKFDDTGQPNINLGNQPGWLDCVVAPTAQEALTLVQERFKRPESNDFEYKFSISDDLLPSYKAIWDYSEPEYEDKIPTGWHINIGRDNDVLDTWFSSALWPFGTLGWPEVDPPRKGEVARSDGGVPPLGTEHNGQLGPLHHPSDCPPPRAGEDLLARHYPNDVLVSGFDILFFWNARMAMQGLHFMKEVPWKTMYLHGLVRAADGSKMSKSKGNTVDPLGLIDQYGADALRFFMAAMESQGRDIKMDEARVAGYRNFATKLWNAARFAQSNGIVGSQQIAAPKADLAVNRWIIGEVTECLTKLNKAFEELRFDGMADTIYHFVWDQYCDWYLELIKPGFVDGEKQDMDAESQLVAGWALDQILVMLHPFMPFITEELWHAMAAPDRPRAYDVIHARWPEPKAAADAQACAEIEWLIKLASAVRSAKNELGIAPGIKLDAFVRDASAVTQQRLSSQSSAIARLARLENISMDDAPEGGSIQLVIEEATFVIPLAGVIDMDAERARITKALEAATKEVAALTGRLNNAAFVEKAKPEAVEKARNDMAEKSAEAQRLSAALERLG